MAEGNGSASTPESLGAAAVVFAQSCETFTPRQFSDFLALAGVELEEESANEFLGDLCDAGRLREIGPGVYAKLPPGDAVALWPEDSP